MKKFDGFLIAYLGPMKTNNLMTFSYFHGVNKENNHGPWKVH